MRNGGKRRSHAQTERPRSLEADRGRGGWFWIPGERPPGTQPNASPGTTSTTIASKGIVLKYSECHAPPKFSRASGSNRRALRSMQSIP
jgi:hypothetical protein